MSTHTPGPWEARQYLTPEMDDDPMMVYEVLAGDLQERYERLRGDDGDDEPLETIYAENRANARLIASAPDLLELLTEVVSCGYLFEDLGKYPKEAGLANRIRAAIAKAKGE